MARCSMGPRHITGLPGSMKKPIEITRTPCASSGMIMPLKPTGRPVAPSMRGTENP
jgi:hypothetical protein